MSFSESALLFDCKGDELVGVVAAPKRLTGDVGVVVVVGGPQYRVGSHRQFLLLSRQLAAEGLPVLRFDYRGMGDSTGEARSFESVDDDIRAGVDALQQSVPGVRRVVLWGLCDGASAVSLYAPTDSRVVGCVLLNPWVRTVVGEAKTYLRHYYVRRLLSPDFWKKLLTGGVAVSSSLGGALKMARLARGGGRSDAGAGRRGDPGQSLPQRMAGQLERSGVPTLIVLSGNDFVANEFESCAANDVSWSRVFAQAKMLRIDEANHTFSTQRWRDEVAQHTRDWIMALEIQTGGQ